MKKGKLYGVSTGPGDPELLTLKALRCIEKAEVLAVPKTRGGRSLTLEIVSQAADISGKEILYLSFIMKKDKALLHQSHKEAAEQIMEILQTGRDVAMLNLGDASLYGTYGYIREIVRDAGYDTETIPGVTSFCAVAAALETDLADMEEPIMILPGSFGEIDQALSLSGTKVIMKSGSALTEVRDQIVRAGLSDRAGMVANCGMPDEKIVRKIEDIEGTEGYFATIIVKSGKE